MLSGSII